MVTSETCCCLPGQLRSTYHVPEEVGQPVDQRTDAADKLEVLGLSDPLLDQVEDKTGRDEGHGKDDANCHDGINRGGQPGGRDGKRKTRCYNSVINSSWMLFLPLSPFYSHCDLRELLFSEV